MVKKTRKLQDQLFRLRNVIIMLLAIMIVCAMTACEKKNSDSASSDPGREENEVTKDSSEAEDDLITEEEIAEAGNYLEKLDLDIWDGSIAGSYAGGSGTESDPWQISNGEELALMAQDINHNTNNDNFYILTSDIQLNDLSNWESWVQSPPANKFEGIGVDTYPEKYFSGQLDGQGHIIYGMYSEKGMFPVLSDAKISNINIDASVVHTSQGDHAGGLIGEVYSNWGIEVKNCSFNGIIQGDSNSSCGGIIGSMTVMRDSGNTQVSLQYCKNFGTINGYHSAGGIIGELSTEGINTDILFCENYGDITGYTSSGGIAGSIDVGLYSEKIITVRNCRNTGNVTAEAGLGSEGGIIGDVGCGAGDRVIIASCVNSNSGGIIDEYVVAADGTLIFNGCDYKSGSAPYDRAQKSAIYGNLVETNLLSLSENEFRDHDLPLLADAEEARETGEYVKYNGKMYYVGYSQRLFEANYDGSQEREIALLLYTSSGDNYYRYKNYLCYVTSGADSYSRMIALYDMDTSEETFIEKNHPDAYLFGMKDGTAYYGIGTDKTVYEYSIEDGQTDTIVLKDIDGMYGFIQMTDSWFAMGWSKGDEDEATGNTTYSFWDMEGNLISEKTSKDFGENTYVTLLDGFMCVYSDGKFALYDPLSDSLVHQVEYDVPDMVGIQKIDDKYLYVYKTDGSVEKIEYAENE